MLVNGRKKECLLQWVSLLLNKDVQIEDFKDGSILLLLLAKTHEEHSANPLSTKIETFCQVSDELSGFYQVKIDALINFVTILDDSDGVEFNLFALLLLVLAYGLQSKNSADFKRCACQLSQELQQEIMHVTEELLQADPLEGRPVNAEMLACLSRERGEERSYSVPVQNRRLNFDFQDNSSTPKLYTNSPSTPLRDWLDSPQMVQKSKLRLKEQELKQLRRQMMEDQHIRHEAEFELEKLKLRVQALESDKKSLETKLATQVQIINDQKDQLSELVAKETVFEQREMDWKKMQEKLENYKLRAKEAGWWEKECDEVIHERESLRLKALALEERRNYMRDRQQVESQMSDLISSLREADRKMRSLMEERNKTAAISEALQRRNDELERRMSCINLDDSFPSNATLLDEPIVVSGDVDNGESMRVVSDLRICELEAQLAEMTEKMVPRDELAKANATLVEVQEQTVPKEHLADAKKELKNMEMEKIRLLGELQSLQKRYEMVTEERERIMSELSAGNDRYSELEKEKRLLDAQIESLKASIAELKIELEHASDELEHSSAIVSRLETQLKKTQKQLEESEEICTELQSESNALKAALNKLKQNEIDFQNERNLLISSIEQKEVELRNLNEKMSEMELVRLQNALEIERLTKDLAHTNSFLEEIKSDVLSKTSLWQEKEDTLQKELSCVKEELDSVRLMNNSMNEEKEVILSELKRTSDACRQRQEQVDLLSEKLATSMSARNEATLEIEQLHNTVQELNDRKQAQESQYHETKEALISAISNAETLRLEKDELLSEVKTLTEKCLTTENSLSKYEIELKGWEIANKNWEENLEIHKRKFEDLEEVHETLVRDFENLCNERDACVKEHETVESQLRAKNDNLSMTVVKLEEERNQLQIETEAVRSQLSNSMIKKNSLEILKHEIDCLTGKLKCANEKYSRTKNDEERLRHELSILKANVMELETQYNEVSREVDLAKLETNRLESEYSEKTKESERRLAEALKELQSVSSERDRLLCEVSALEEELKSLENDRLEIVREQEELSGAIEKNNMEVAEFEAYISDCDSLVGSFKNRVEELESTCADYVEDLAEKTRHLSEMKIQLTKKDEEFEEMASQLLMNCQQTEALKEDIACKNEQLETLRQQFDDLTALNDRVASESLEIAGELQNLQTMVVEYRSVIENKEKLLTSLKWQLDAKEESLQKSCIELNLTIEKFNTEQQKVKELESLRFSLRQELSVLNESHEKIVSEKELLSVTWKAAEEENEKCMTAMREEMDKLLREQDVMSAELQAAEVKIQQEIAASTRSAEERAELEVEVNNLATRVRELEMTVNEYNLMQAKCEELREQLDSSFCATASLQNEKKELQKELSESRDFVKKLEAEQENRMLEVSAQLAKMEAEVSQHEQEREGARREVALVRSDVDRLQAENENHMTEINCLRKENDRLLNLQDDIARLESELEMLGSELEAAERQRLELAQSLEKEWNDRMMRVEEENIHLMQRNKDLEEKLSEAQCAVRDASLRLDEELLAASHKLEQRERALTEERQKLKRTAEEAREMVEAYREMLNAQMDEEREEESQKKDRDATALAMLTAELESVRQNHQRLVEAQDEEMQNARREAEAFQEEARLAEESVRSLQTNVKHQEKTISLLEEEREKLKSELQNMRKEVNSAMAESVALQNDLDQRETALAEVTFRREELERTHQMNVTTINNLSVRCESIQQEFRETKTERDAIEAKLHELEERYAVEEERAGTLAHHLENSRDEVNAVLGRLTAALRDKEEATCAREHHERRLDEIASECNEWKAVSDRYKAENNRLKEELKAIENAEAGLRQRCSSLESAKSEATNSTRELSERYERLRNRTADIEEDHREAVRTYRIRLEMAEERCNASETEIADLETQVSEWRVRAQKLGTALQEQEERLRTADESRRNVDEQLTEERQARERYRIRCTELQAELLRLDKQVVDLQSSNRQLVTKMRSLEMQLEFTASDAAGTSVVISKSNVRPPVGTSHVSPVFGNHLGQLSRSYSEGGNLTTFFDNIGRTTPRMTTPSRSDALARSETDEQHPLRRRHSSPLTPVSRSHRSFAQLARCKEAEDCESVTSNSTIRSAAPVTALASLFSCEDEPMDGMEWKRIQELQKRNKQQRSHLQSSYPVETQMCNPEEITQALGGGSTTSLSGIHSKEARRKPFSDLSNPYRQNRMAPNAVSEELLRQGSDHELHEAVSRMDRHISGVSVSNADAAKAEVRYGNAFKVPFVPAASYSGDQERNVKFTSHASENSDQENYPTQMSDIDRKNISFEVKNTPKKSGSRAHLFSQHKKKQKYSVQNAEKAASGETHHQQKPNALESRYPMRSPTKRSASAKTFSHSTQRHMQRERRLSVPETPATRTSRPNFFIQKQPSPVRGRRSLSEDISSNRTSRPQPGLVDRRGAAGQSDSQRLTKKLVSLARRLTPKRKNRVGDSYSTPQRSPKK